MSKKTVSFFDYKHKTTKEELASPFSTEWEWNENGTLRDWSFRVNNPDSVKALLGIDASLDLAYVDDIRIDINGTVKIGCQERSYALWKREGHRFCVEEMGYTEAEYEGYKTVVDYMMEQHPKVVKAILASDRAIQMAMVTLSKTVDDLVMSLPAPKAKKAKAKPKKAALVAA